jgi:NADPH-dependent glutamate synthase beta subunit-like oxidoreductase/NAD(P)H-flavin reductase
LGVSPFRFADLFDHQGLGRLEQAFDAALLAQDPTLHGSFVRWREGETLAAGAESALMIDVAAPLGRFVADLFGLSGAAQALQGRVQAEDVVHAFKRQFVDRRVRRRKPQPGDVPLDEATFAALCQGLAANVPHEDAERLHATVAMGVLKLWQVVDHRPAKPPEEMEAARKALEGALGRGVAPEALRPTLEGLLTGLEIWHGQQLGHKDWVSYRTPEPISPNHLDLVDTEAKDQALPEALQGPSSHHRARHGFGLTDSRMNLREAQAQIDYCLLCHPRGKDSCRHGLKDHAGAVKKTPLGTPLTGCPLEERISEAHVLAGRGELIAALAMIMVDNPMVPGTGHRICNDCMKACVFQKQSPVDIPQAETHILTEVLALPFGFEIYGLLTRFNPLRRSRPIPRPFHGHKALVVGLGPAGYTLAHYLLQEGFGVVAVDGLKLEPQDPALVGADVWPPQAVADIRDIQEDLAERSPKGFGGVAEYGITVRWDKNFLQVIYLTLARNRLFAAYGGIRFGGTVTLDDAWALGFDHVALAAGAGRPTVVALQNNLMRGMRTASDFLMGLQQGGAFRDKSLTNLQVELPAVVIGGGLTAIDTATELMAYYPVQIQKLQRLVRQLSLPQVLADLDQEERQILGRMLAHAEQLELELTKSKPDVAALVRQWGGVSVAYRKGLVDSPAYRLNHEEVQKALEEGITFVEHVAPFAAEPDAFGHVAGLRVRRQDGTAVTLPARSVIMAAGTSPNTIYERELPGSIALDARGRFFAAHCLAEDGASVKPASPWDAGAFFTSYAQGETATGVPRLVSFYGDNHPRYAGNVVRAMASAKDGHLHVARLFERAMAAQTPDQAAHEQGWQSFVHKLDGAWRAHVVAVNRLTPTIVEVVLHAPTQARKFLPGQFFRLQNFERDALRVADQPITMEGLALTGAWVDAEAGTLGMIALEMGVSSRLVALLAPGQEVVLMGPTGAPTDIPTGESVVLCGGGLGNAVLFSVAHALRARGNKVLYFAGYKDGADIYKREDIERSADQVIWSVDQGEAPKPGRSQDRVFRGNIVQAMEAYGRGELGQPVVPLESVDRIIAIGSDRMMAAVAHARRSSLAHLLNKTHVAVASINSPMQCMLKEVCAQCLQRHVDPDTGKETYVFSCFNQDQPQDTMDWQHLAARLRQNTVLEKVTGRYVENLMKKEQAL